MYIKSISPSDDCTLTTISQRACLPLAIAGLLLSSQAQALLPTPLSVVATGELASSPQNTEIDEAASTAPYNNGVKTDINSVKTDIQGSENVQSTQNSKSEALLANWREQVKTKNLAQHTTWRRLLYFLDDKKGLLGKNKNVSVVEDPSFFE